MSTQAAAAQKSNLLRHPDFLKFWSGQTVSNLGSSVTDVALPLTAILLLNAGPVEMGLLSTLYLLPSLLFSLFAGAWVDRLPRRRVMIWSDIGRAVILGLIPLSMLLGYLSMGLIYFVIFTSSALTDLFEIANMSFLPSLVSREQLIEGNSKMNASASAAQVVGPGLGGLLIQLISAPFAILLDSLSFVVSVLSLAWIRTPEPRRPVQAVIRPNILREIHEGMRAIYQNPVLLSIAGCGLTYNFFMMLWSAQYDLYMVRSLHFSPVIIGIVLAAYAPGGLLASLIADRVAGPLGIGRVLMVSMLLVNLFFFLLLVSQGPFWLILAAQLLSAFLGRFFLVIFNLNLLSLRQAITPTHLLGRTAATMRFFTRGAMPLAGLASGGLSVWLGLWPVMLIGVAGGLLSFPWLLFSPVRSLKTIPEPMEDSVLPPDIQVIPQPESPQN